MDDDNALRDLLDASTGASLAQNIASRFGLGRVHHADELPGGAGRRNALLQTDTGQWVLRAGVDPATLGFPCRHLSSAADVLRSERFFANALRQTTGLTAAWPYEIDDRGDLLAAPYAVMPKLEGSTLWWNEERDWTAVGAAMAEVALAIHRQRWPAAGVWDPASNDIAPDGRPIAMRVQEHLADLTDRLAQTSEALDPSSRSWVTGIVAAMERAPEPAQASLVHGDLAIGNVCMTETAGRWTVTGVFDLEVARIGDAEEDLGELWWPCYGGHPEFAAAFLRRYTEERPTSDRLPAHVILRMLENWEFGRSHGFGWFGSARTFAEWAAPLYDTVIREIDAAR